MTSTPILLDLNVILDFLQARQPHSRYADRLFAAAAKSRATLWISGDSPSTIFYVLERSFRQAGEPEPSLQAQKRIRTLLAHVAVAPVTQAVLELAMDWRMVDYEDAIQAACALEAGVGILVTRDRLGFKDLPPTLLAVLSPVEALAILGSNGDSARPRRPRTRG
jgi:predicted nucleic acid-binding protein